MPPSAASSNRSPTSSDAGLTGCAGGAPELAVGCQVGDRATAGADPRGTTDGTHPDSWREATMRLSIRNQLSATIETITRGEVMGTIRLRLDGGQEVTSAITLDAVDDLG